MKQQRHQKHRASANDAEGLIKAAEANGWTVEESKSAYGSIIYLSSPVGKYGDWATIRIEHTGNKKSAVKILTRRNYHRAHEGDRGIWIAQHALNPAEQWRYSKAGL